MRPLIALFAVLLLWPAQASQPKPTTEKKPVNPERIYKLFVDEFVLLTPGKGKFPASFQMGSATGPASEQPVRKVTFGYAFAIAKYEVTQELYELVMGSNPSKWKGPRNSVEVLTWHDANTFCRKLTATLRERQQLGAEEEIRLPSEAEWEYACRAGTTTDYSFGDNVQELGEYCWYKENSKGHDPPVGAKKANPWGLYDMHGYIWEWCADHWHATYAGAPTDGSAWSSDKAKAAVARSGSWAHPAEQCRSTARMEVPLSTVSDTIGFRCVRAAVKKGSAR